MEEGPQPEVGGIVAGIFGGCRQLNFIIVEKYALKRLSSCRLYSSNVEMVNFDGSISLPGVCGDSGRRNVYFIFFLLDIFCLCFEAVGLRAITHRGIMYENGTSNMKP